MPNLVKWSSPTNVSAPISGASAVANAGALGTEYDNETAKNRFATFELNFTHGSAPTANRVWLLYILLATDGTNYEDGDASTKPAKMHTIAFPVRAVTTSQRVTIPNVLIPPFKFKPLTWNDTNQNGASVTLNMEVFNEEIQ